MPGPVRHPLFARVYARLATAEESEQAEHRRELLSGLTGRVGEHMARAQQHMTDLVRDFVAEGAQVGALRSDIAAEELAAYCLHALTAASGLPSKAAVRRLVAVTLAGLQPAAALS